MIGASGKGTRETRWQPPAGFAPAPGLSCARVTRTICTVLTVVFLVDLAPATWAYPIDGFERTGMRRLARLSRVVEGAISGPNLTVGQKHSAADIELNLVDAGLRLGSPPDRDPALQAALDKLFADRDSSYAIALLDITPGRGPRYAGRRDGRVFEPGSVGKLAIISGLFAELRRLYPDDPAQRLRLLRSRVIEADEWILHDEHDIPVYEPASGVFVSRPAAVGDEFSLFEWADHMMSASANSAASTVWKEIILMRAFGAAYPPSRAEEERFFRQTSPGKLQEYALATANDPLRAAGIAKQDWQLGSLFTRTGKKRIPQAGSWATPRGMLLFLLRLEQGEIVDEWSSLEIKRLMYMTAKRIRYASSPAIARSRVYFKSGSLYRCQPEEGFACRKYMGNKDNIMNSVCIVETSDGRIYLVAMTSNVLRRNSAVDHQTIAKEIESLMK